MALPVLTEEQRQANLEKAAAARQARSELCARIKSGELDVADVLSMRGEPVVDRLRIYTLLSSLPGFGKARVTKLMEELQISERCRVKGLGVRQEKRLLEKMAEKAER